MSDRKDDVKVYQDKKAKAEDYKSSAYTLLLVGVVGLVALILMISGALPFRFAGASRYITYGVMGVLFVIFIMLGFSSFKSSKKYAKEATDEDELTRRVKAWVEEQLTAESIKNRVWFEGGTSDEEKYFQYFEIIKTAVTQEFGSLNASYLDALCEELYAELFEEKSHLV